MGKTPYGESRRLRYLFYICNFYMENHFNTESEVEVHLVKSLDLFNKYLLKYKRSTGVLRTIPVAHNYLSFCYWLNLINKEGKIISPNGNTIFFSNISNNINFELIDIEKISMFILITKKNEFMELLTSLKPMCTPKDFKTNIRDEHLIETFLEWCIDIDILLSSSKKFGKYYLNPRFLKLIKNIRKENRNELIRLYSTLLLNKNILMERKLSDKLIWENFIISLNKTQEYTRSEIDNNLYSALPSLFELQVSLILKYHTYISLEKLIEMMETIALKYNSFFTWNYMKEGGLIKIGR